MGSRFREQVLRVLRPHFKVFGNSRDGFSLVSRSENSVPYFLDRTGPAKLISCMGIKAAKEAGFEVWGDAEISIQVFPEHRWLNFQTFVAAMIVHSFHSDPIVRSVIRFRAKIRGWQDIQSSLSANKDPTPHFRRNDSISPPRRACLIEATGNFTIHACAGSNYSLFQYLTS